MRYYYGTIDSTHDGRGIESTPKDIATLIRLDVKAHQWNTYYKVSPNRAGCKFTSPGYDYKARLHITGTEKEFAELENLIKDLNLMS